MKAIQPTTILAALATALMATAPVQGQEKITDLEKGERLFSVHVSTIFAEKCNSCHGDDLEKIKGEFDMTTLDGLLAGGESISDVLVPGDPEKSYLLDIVEWKDPDYEMPPKENDRLSEDQITKIRSWISYGAPWPDEETREKYRLQERNRERTEEGIIMPTRGGLSDEWSYRRYKEDAIWAFQPIKNPDVPAAEGATEINPIDAFIGARLTDAGFDPAPQADPNTLLRRATYDLTGLPPTPEEVKTFQSAWKEDSTKAWNELVDRLLATDQYGERWAQHWLDVARYADTAGFSNDYERSNAWRYRDYVIRAFREDKPYNEFIIEQLAGDELADQSMRARIAEKGAQKKARLEGHYTEEESELLVASSFLRMGPWDPAMVKTAEARQLYIDDVLNAVGQTFLSTTMRCFKCHDHKFDPLPTRDYYRMYSIFSGTQVAERPAPFLADENKIGFEEEKEFADELLAYAKGELERLNKKSKAATVKWREENGIAQPDKDEGVDVPDDKKPPRHVGLNEQEKGQLKVRKQDEWIWQRRQERFKPFVQSVYNGPTPKSLNSRKLRIVDPGDKKWEIQSHILSGGSIEAPADEVTPGVLSVLGIPTETATEEDPYRLTEDFDGRRLQLAKWIARDDNPLTARSIVNRVWQYHFGQAIAGSPNNFSVSGKKPTHPELLDWLASDFVENGWKLKRLHRLIMSSQTYRQSGLHPEQEKLANVDANNELFARFPNRRLSAEELRDSMLKVTGELNTEPGGLPIRPEMNMEVALQPRMIQFSIAPAYQPSRAPEQRNRRSIYAYRVRGLADPFLETFNQPNPNDSCADRDSASVSPQAFTLLNSDLVTDRSVAFAQRVEREADTIDEQVSRAVELAFGRAPTSTELETLGYYVKEMQNYHADVSAEPKEYPTEITRSLVEEFSGQPFEYEEILPIFEDYIPDSSAADVTPETRALADLCLALFNSNEFVYVY